MSSNNEIRYRILKITYDLFHDNPKRPEIDRIKLKDMLGVSENIMDANILYLEQKYLIKLHKAIGSLWRFAVIRALGIDVIENKEKYKEKFPFIQVQIVQGNNYGNMAQAGANSNVTISQMNEAFQRARDLTNAKTDVPIETKKEVDSNLTSLEDELKKAEPELGKVQKTWKWLKSNASWVVPILAEIVIEASKNGM